MILTVVPSGEGHPAHQFLWSQDHGSTTPPSYGKTFKIFEPYGALGLKYHFETYSTSVSHDHIIIVHHQKGPNVVDDSSSGRIFCILSIATICQPLPSHRLIIEPCLRCDARAMPLSIQFPSLTTFSLLYSSSYSSPFLSKRKGWIICGAVLGLAPCSDTTSRLPSRSRPTRTLSFCLVSLSGLLW